MKKLCVIAALLLAFAPLADARIARSQSARMAFVKANACPATGLHKLPCSGWIIDHRIALACKGLDIPANMQWMTIAAAKQKDKWELKGCKVKK